MAAAPAGSAGDSDARDAAWLSRLHRNRSGRVLQDHLACVEDRLDSHGREGSIQEAINNRRCFLRAVNSQLTRGRGLPCGLPTPVPRFVAIVNLSGQRMVLTSNHDTMLRKLCARSWSMHPDMLNDQLSTFTAFLDHATMTAVMPSGSTAKAHAEQFVLITYSLPWQAGMSTAFWEVNAVSMIGDAQGQRFVYDRMCSLTSMSTHVFAGRSTLNERGADDGVCLRAGQPEERVLDFIGPEQIKAFGDAYAAVSLDFENDSCRDALPATGASADGAEVGAVAGPRGGGLDGGGGLAAAKAKATDATMRGILEAMKKDRIKEQSATKALQAKLDALSASHALELQAKEEDMLAKVDEALSRAANRERVADAEVAEIRAEFDGVRAKMSNLLVEQSEGRSKHAELLKKFEKLKRQEASKDKLHNTAMSKQSNEIKRLQEQLEAEKRAHGEILAELAKAHAQALERAASQGANERTALKQKLASTELMCNQLAENAENSGREFATAQARVAALRSEAQGWKDKHKRASAASDAIAAWNGALVVAQTTLLAEVALLEAAPPPPAPPAPPPEPVAGDRVYLLPVRSVAAETDTQGTATHSAAETQTADARVLAEHLPEGALRERLKPPPAQRQAPPPPPPKALATTDDEPPPEPPPSPTPSTGSTQEPPPSAAPLGASAPLNASASPFGSPAMACLQAEAAFNHLLEWMRYFGAMQLHQQGVHSPHHNLPSTHPHFFGVVPRASPPPLQQPQPQPQYHHHHQQQAGRGRPTMRGGGGRY